jgi:iron complex outermembrane receptor protein
MSYVFEFVVDDDIDLVGSIGSPQSRATFSNSYTIGDFILAWNIQYIDSQENLFEDVKVSNWVTHNPQINYMAPWNGQFGIGAQNVFDEKPPLDQWNSYDTWL